MILSRVKFFFMSNLRRFQGKDNALLVEFEFMVDTDIGLWRFIKEAYYDDPVVNREFLDFEESKATAALIARQKRNPLALIAPLCDYDTLYDELMTNQELTVLQHSTPYSSFGMIRTINNEASSVTIDILCQNEIEVEYIRTLAEELNVIVGPKSEVDPERYSAFYLKYITSFRDYPEMRRRYVYVANAGFNTEPGKYCLNLEVGAAIEAENVLKSIDPYQYIKFLNFPVDQTQTTTKEEQA